MKRSLPLDFEPRAVCPRCERPVLVCYCAHLTSVDTRTRVVLLQHPREEDMAIGTARMASLCLPNSELHVGVDFQTSPALARALSSGANESERLDAIEDALGQLDHTLAMLSAMLDIARAESGLSRQMMRPVDIAALVEEVADFFAPIIEDAGQTLELKPPVGEVVALAHEALLRQAIGNLLHNAAIYGGAGVDVTVAVARVADQVSIVIADTGQGAPAEQLGRIQQRFVRLDPARGGGGSGLGLAIVAACAKLHGGALRLEDNRPGLMATLEISADGAET